MDKKCFGISGNFQQYGAWSQPDPSFIGYILVNEDGMLEGYMDEQYGSYDSLRFVTGKFKDNKLVYFKLGCSNRLAPLVYIFKDINQDGHWNAFDFPNVEFGGIAKVNLKETDLVAPHLEKIQATKAKIIKGPFWNEILVNNLQEVLHEQFEKL